MRTKINGKAKAPKIEDSPIASKNEQHPIKNEHIANKIFIPISQANPSSEKLKISPGNLIVNFAQYTNISVINVFEIMQ